VHCSLRCVRLLSLAVAYCVAVANANTITYTDTWSSAEGQKHICEQGVGVSLGSCPPFDVLVPEFNPALGILNAIQWSFTDYQQYLVGVNDEYNPQGVTYSFTNTGGDSAPLLNMTVSKTQTVNGVVLNPYNATNISEGSSWDINMLMASGTLTGDDVDPFIGTEPVVNIVVTPFLSQSPVVASSGGYVFAALWGVMDGPELTVTYDYTTATPAPIGTPEPRDGIAFLAAAFSIALWLRTRTRHRL
jgi:hypothetical protein